MPEKVSECLPYSALATSLSINNFPLNIRTQNEAERKAFYKESCIHLVQIKSLNRKVYQELEDRRSQIEAKKGVVDMLQLSRENLLYKQAYLQREIRACKDLATPNLSEVEKELGMQLASTVFSDNLSQVNHQAVILLEEERLARIETEKVLSTLKEKRDAALKKLDRKRKFMDELPGKIEQISNTVKDIQAQFSCFGTD